MLDIYLDVPTAKTANDAKLLERSHYSSQRYTVSSVCFYRSIKDQPAIGKCKFEKFLQKYMHIFNISQYCSSSSSVTAEM